MILISPFEINELDYLSWLWETATGVYPIIEMKFRILKTMLHAIAFENTVLVLWPEKKSQYYSVYSATIARIEKNCVGSC